VRTRWIRPWSWWRSDDFILTNINPWFSIFLVSNNPLSRNSW
jgi:hypothetical protein